MKRRRKCIRKDERIALQSFSVVMNGVANDFENKSCKNTVWLDDLSATVYDIQMQTMRHNSLGEQEMRCVHVTPTIKHTYTLYFMLNNPMECFYGTVSLIYLCVEWLDVASSLGTFIDFLCSRVYGSGYIPSFTHRHIITL